MSKKKIIWIIVILIIIAIIVGFVKGSSVEYTEDVDMANAPVTVTLHNVSEYTLAPGLIIVHKPEADFGYLGRTAPAEYERLVEVGETEEARVFVASSPGVYEVIAFDTPITAGQVISRDIEGPSDAVFSILTMVVESNDGVAVVLRQALYEGPEKNLVREITVNANLLDMGTEENSPIGSGFDGGQPDHTRGEANLENGTPTSESVRYHTQLDGAVLIVRTSK